MKIKQNFEIVNFADDYMLVPIGNQIDSFNGTVILNEVSSFLINILKVDTTTEELIQYLVNEYDVDLKTAQSDVNTVVEKLKAIGVIDE